MSGAEVIKRAGDAYVAGLISRSKMEKWIAKGVDAEHRGIQVEWAIVHLPLEHQVRDAMEAMAAS